LCGGRDFAWTRPAVAVLAMLLTAFGCITKRVDINLASPAPGPYSAPLRLSTTLGPRGFTASGGCAVDPERGVRIELRDPSGSSQFLLLITRDRAILTALKTGLLCEWGPASRAMPFSSADLWFLFTGRPPQGLRDLQATDKGLTYAAWDGGLGTVSCEFHPVSGTLLPHDSAVLHGPGGARLEIAWSDVRPGVFDDGAFLPPAGFPLTRASVQEVLAEVAQ
jgi:hypothetical protein